MDYRWRIANTLIGGTTLRNQGAKGVEKVAREFLADLDITSLITERETEFKHVLDVYTKELQRAFPPGAQNWGAARKAINLFLGGALDHRIVCSYYEIERIEPFLEIPLDSYVGYYLWNQATFMGNKSVPQWRTIKSLTPENNKCYQDFATVLAQQKGEGWTRVQLDVMIWRERNTLE